MASSSFSLSMAWRDTRGSRHRLALYLTSMVLGVAALVALNGFGDNLQRAVSDEARSLLGADLRFESDAPFADSTEALIDSLGGQQARRLSFASNVVFPAGRDGRGATRLATVRAVEGPFPFYGTLETRPARAAARYQDAGGALVDGALLKQFGVGVGDTVRVGRRGYPILGELVQAPGEAAFVSAASPRVYVPRAGLDTLLLGRGSRLDYEVYFYFAGTRDAEALRAELQPRLRAEGAREGVDVDSVQETARNWEGGLEDLYRFLSLVGFVALILGSLGVASAVHVYVRRRVASIAVLRCLGASAGRTFRIYLVQAAGMGLAGAGLGCLAGLGVQLLVPELLADFLPVEVAFAVSWRALALGMGIGVGVTLLFALQPLLAVRRVSPMRALRSSVEPPAGSWRDPLRWLVGLALAGGVAAFAALQAPTPAVGLGYAAALGVVFGLLTLTARALMAGVRRFFPAAWAYPWRQGLANLYRPNNQTTTLLLALGLGTFLILTLVLVQRSLLTQIDLAGGEGRPNLVFFDIQTDQIDGVTQAVRAEGLPVQQRVPIVTMRLASVKGRTVEAIRADSTVRATWAHRRAYRSTYRDSLIDSETLTAGTLTARYDGDPFDPASAPVPVSLETDIAGALRVEVGDRLTFDVQGVPVQAVVGSLREVDWQRIQTNFFVVFPEGVLGAAPQTFVVLSRAPSEDASAAAQQAVVSRYPNVSAIDLSLVLSTFDELFSRVAFVIRFMALVSVLTGIVVLVGAIVAGRYQRVEESVLLKTLGASRGTVLRILATEYAFLGLFAALTGVALAVGGTWALTTFVFDGAFALAPGVLALTVAAVVALTVTVGLAGSRGIYDRPPLEVLRAEV
jgi:putative ABC transport system permease protein